MLLAVSPHYTSQPCPCCGHASKDNRQTQAKFLCVDCGYENHADVVGAINVLERGYRLLACGESAQSGRSMKRERMRSSHRSDYANYRVAPTATQLDNVVISVTSVENGYFTTGNSSTPISDFTYYQLQYGQIQFVHNGTTLPNMTLTVGDGSAAPMAFSPLVHFFNTDNPANPVVPVEAVVGGATGAVAVTAAVGMTALGVIKYRQRKGREEERNHQTPDLRSVANLLQMPTSQ